ncbi:2Fe-2S iron-sulfur cluster-binding protein [Corynebacterium aquilae]|uniref:Flavodoxin n=1 Tax=Corynebacterium aquilae DSM 44791 TaxID=1431546 RepID=A0A1L7CI10_9CORY|nr:2Fe-2S iron-sulfur cluster binding domain-containing protein [Corynebacterium aquilae]APT85455.1 flavodoxin [Corynebacterium aquilae DSM 44791]
MSEIVGDNVVELDGVEYRFEWPADKTLLQSMLDAGIPAPHSCQMGRCGACRVHVEGPQTRMRENHVLDDFDVEAGDRLACQTLRNEGDLTAAELDYPF